MLYFIASTLQLISHMKIFSTRILRAYIFLHTSLRTEAPQIKYLLRPQNICTFYEREKYLSVARMAGKYVTYMLVLQFY